MVGREEGKELTAVEVLINQEIQQLQVEGFVPGKPPERIVKPEAPKPVSRLKAAVFSDSNGENAKLPPKTLGSRFKTSRRRRL